MKRKKACQIYTQHSTEIYAIIEVTTAVLAELSNEKEKQLFEPIAFCMTLWFLLREVYLVNALHIQNLIVLTTVPHYTC